MEPRSVDHTLFLCDLQRKNVERKLFIFVDAGCHRRTRDLHQLVGSYLEGYAHGTRDIDAEEQQRLCCERLFVRVEQKQAVMVTV